MTVVPTESQICIQITDIAITVTIGTMLRSQLRGKHTHTLHLDLRSLCKGLPETLVYAKLLQPRRPTYSCRLVFKYLVNISQSREEPHQVGTNADGTLSLTNCLPSYKQGHISSCAYIHLSEIYQYLYWCLPIITNVLVWILQRSRNNRRSISFPFTLLFQS